VNISDQWSGSKCFPNILETKEFEKDTYMATDSRAFVFIFESNQQMVITPFRIEIATEKTIFIVVNMPFINEIQRSVMSALQGEQLDFSFYRDAATEKALKYMDTGKEFIEQLKKGEY
jgi:hypothetical protein